MCSKVEKLFLLLRESPKGVINFKKEGGHLFVISGLTPWPNGKILAPPFDHGGTYFLVPPIEKKILGPSLANLENVGTPFK